jgi:hypothetical protein
MKKSITWRMGWCLAAALVVCAFVAPTALAAGPPTEVSAEWSWAENYTAPTVNGDGFAGKANPNGSSTTLYYEYKKEGASSYTIGATAGIGSGTSVVSVAKAIWGYEPSTPYERRVTAKNAYGEVHSNVLYARTFGWSRTATFESSGTLTMAWEKSGVPNEVRCTESGYGRLGNSKPSENYFHINTSGCAYYSNGKYLCKPNFNPALDLNSGYWNTETGIKMEFPEECLNSTITISTPNAFAETGIPFEVFKVEQPLTLTTKGWFGSSAVTITDQSTWRLTGASTGKSFAIGEW